MQKEIIWCLDKVNIIRELPEASKQKLAEVASKREVSRGALIFGPYDSEEKIFVIREGEVEIYQLSQEGKKVIIDILVPGNIFGNSSFSAEPLAETHDFAMARSRVILCVFRKSDFMDVLARTPELAMGLIEEISSKLNEAAERIRDLAVSNATTRLINELVRFAKRAGEETEDKVIMGVKLTHEELAELTGITRETVTRMLKKLRQDEILDFDKSRHIIIDKQKVKQAFASLNR
jgi:CRP-like cAMP-binding protein